MKSKRFYFEEPETLEDSIFFIQTIDYFINAFISAEKDKPFTVAQLLIHIEKDEFKKILKFVKTQSGVSLESAVIKPIDIIEIVGIIGHYVENIEIPDYYANFIGGISRDSYRKMINHMQYLLNKIEEEKQYSPTEHLLAYLLSRGDEQK